MLKTQNYKTALLTCKSTLCNPYIKSKMELPKKSNNRAVKSTFYRVWHKYLPILSGQ